MHCSLAVARYAVQIIPCIFDVESVLRDSNTTCLIIKVSIAAGLKRSSRLIPSLGQEKGKFE